MNTTQADTEALAHLNITALVTAPDKRLFLTTLAPSVLRVMADLMYAPCDADLAGKATLIRAILTTL